MSEPASNPFAGLVLMGVAEAAELASVTKAAINQWQQRHKSFPRPLAVLRSGPVWNADDLKDWLLLNRPRKSTSG